MRSLCLWCGLALLWAAPAHAQPRKIDSLQQQLAGLRDTARVNALNQLAHLQLPAQVDLGRKYAQQAMVLAQSLSYYKGTARALYLMAVADLALGQLQTALRYAQKAAEVYAELGDVTSQAQCWVHMATVYERTTHHAYALAALRRAQEAYQQLKQPADVAAMHLAMGRLHATQQQYAPAANAYQQALQQYQTLKDQVGMSRACLGLGYVQQLMQQYEQALGWYQRSYAAATAAKQPAAMAASADSLASLALQRSLPAQAQQHYTQALELYRQASDAANVAHCHQALGLLAQKQAQYALALTHYQAALLSYQQLQNRAAESAVTTQLAAVYAQLGNTDQSIRLAEQGLQMARLAGHYETVQQAALTLSEIYSRQRNYAKAYEYYIQYAAMKDTLSSQDFIRKLTVVDQKVQVEQLHAEQALLQKDDALRTLQSIMWVAGSVLILALFVALVAVKRSQQRITTLLASQRDELKASGEVLARAYQDVSHKHQQLDAGLQQAGRMQQALLPLPQRMAEAFPAHFVLYQPNAVVSGDFYWLADAKDKTVLAVVDGVSQGVPGALVSMFADALLHQVVHERGITRPDLVLQAVHMAATRLLREHEQQAVPGLALSVLCIDKRLRQLEFSSVRNPLLLLRGQQVSEIKGDNLSIGDTTLPATPAYTLHSHTLDVPTTYVLLTGGLMGQPGQEGPYDMQRFKQFWIDHRALPLATQRSALQQHLAQWMGKKPQQDDILVLALQWPTA